jgi:hypothetical protein
MREMMKPRRSVIKTNKFKEGYAPSQPAKHECISGRKTIVSRCQSQAITLNAPFLNRKTTILDAIKPYLSNFVQHFSTKVISPFFQRIQSLNNIFFNKMDQIMLSEDVFCNLRSEREQNQSDDGTALFVGNEHHEAARQLFVDVRFWLMDVEKLMMRRVEKVRLFFESLSGFSAKLQLKPVVFEVVNGGKNPNLLNRSLTHNNIVLNDLSGFISIRNANFRTCLCPSRSFDSKSIVKQVFDIINIFVSKVLIKKFVEFLSSVKLSLKKIHIIPVIRIKPEKLLANPGYP